MTPELWTAVRLSLQVGVWVALLGAPIAIGLGWLLARGRFRGRTALSALLMVPLVLPPVVTGYLLLVVFGRSGPLGALGIPFTFGAAVLAAGIVGLPLYVLATRAAFEAVDPAYEDVAATLGVRPSRVFLRVTLPLAAPGLAGGALLAFARALGEFGATAVIAGNVEGETRTIPMAVYSLLASPDGDRGALWLACASVAMSVLAVVAYEWFRRRQRERLELEG